MHVTLDDVSGGKTDPSLAEESGRGRHVVIAVVPGSARSGRWLEQTHAMTVHIWAVQTPVLFTMHKSLNCRKIVQKKLLIIQYNALFEHYI